MANKPWDGPWEDGDQFNADHVNRIVKEIKDNQTLLGRTVSYDDQDDAGFTPAQRKRARDNIGAVGTDAALIYYDSTDTSILDEAQKEYFRTTIGAGTGDVYIQDFASPYDATKTYKIGDLCSYNSRLYICIADITEAAPWDTNLSHWQLTTIGEQYNNVVEQVADRTDAIIFDDTVDLLGLIGINGYQLDGYGLVIGNTPKSTNIQTRYSLGLNSDGEPRNTNLTTLVFHFTTPIKIYVNNTLLAKYTRFLMQVDSPVYSDEQLIEYTATIEKDNESITMVAGKYFSQQPKGKIYSKNGNNDTISDSGNEVPYAIPSDSQNALTIQTNQHLSITLLTTELNRYGCKINVVKPHSLILDYIVRNKTALSKILNEKESPKCAVVYNSSGTINCFAPFLSDDYYWKYTLISNDSHRYSLSAVTRIDNITSTTIDGPAFRGFEFDFRIKTDASATESLLAYEVVESDPSYLLVNNIPINQYNASANYGKVYYGDELKFIEHRKICINSTGTNSDLELGTHIKQFIITPEGFTCRHRITWDNISGYYLDASSVLLNIYTDSESDDKMLTNSNYEFKNVYNYDLSSRQANEFIYVHDTRGYSMNVKIITDLPLYIGASRTLENDDPRFIEIYSKLTNITDYAITANSTWEWEEAYKFTYTEPFIVEGSTTYADE